MCKWRELLTKSAAAFMAVAMLSTQVMAGEIALPTVSENDVPAVEMEETVSAEKAATLSLGQEQVIGLKAGDNYYDFDHMVKFTLDSAARVTVNITALQSASGDVLESDFTLSKGELDTIYIKGDIKPRETFEMYLPAGTYYLKNTSEEFTYYADDDFRLYEDMYYKVKVTTSALPANGQVLYLTNISHANANIESPVDIVADTEYHIGSGVSYALHCPVTGGKTYKVEIKNGKTLLDKGVTWFVSSYYTSTTSDLGFIYSEDSFLIDAKTGSAYYFVPVVTTDLMEISFYDTKDYADAIEYSVYVDSKPHITHVYGAEVVVKAPTCTQAGVKQKTCSGCGDVKNSSIPATGVHVKDNGQIENGATVYRCAMCRTIMSTSAKVKLSSVKHTNSRKATVKWKANSTMSGYQIQYGTKKNFKGAKSKTVNGSSKKSVTLKSLKSGKTYYVRIRGFIKQNGNTAYGAWSSAKKVKIYW